MYTEQQILSVGTARWQDLADIFTIKTPVLDYNQLPVRCTCVRCYNNFNSTVCQVLEQWLELRGCEVVATPNAMLRAQDMSVRCSCVDGVTTSSNKVEDSNYWDVERS